MIPEAENTIVPKTSSAKRQPAEAREFTLNAAIQWALKADPQIQAGFENIHQVEADLITAGLLPNPSFFTSQTLMPLTRSFSATRQGGPPQFDAGVEFPIDWFLFGKRAAAIVAAQRSVDVAAADFAELVRQRIAGTISAFYDVLEAQAMLALAWEDLGNLSKVKGIIANRVKIGGVGTIELDRIRLSIFSSRREVRAREVALAAALSRLRAFLGFEDAITLIVQGNLGVAHPVMPISAEVAMALAEENRPDLIALRRQVVQAAANVQAEEKRAYPEVTPRIGYTRQFQKKAIGYPDADSWGVGIEVTMPLFDRNQGNIAKVKSFWVQSELNLSAQLVALRAEIDQAVQAYQAAYRILTTDDLGQLEAARNVRDKIRASYELGGKSLIEVLDAQRTYRETYRLHIASRSGYWHSLYALNAAIGKQVLK
jgi:cobalt-zinc-cadmium efflux system outer membrane protein